jgi:hypothetical protein
MIEISDALICEIEAERRRLFQARGIIDCAVHAVHELYECGADRPDIEAALEAAMALIDQATDRLDTTVLGAAAKVTPARSWTDAACPQ